MLDESVKIFWWLPIIFRAKFTLLPEVYKAMCAATGRSYTLAVFLLPGKLLASCLTFQVLLSFMATSSERSSMMFWSRCLPHIPIDDLCLVSLLTYFVFVWCLFPLLYLLCVCVFVWCLFPHQPTKVNSHEVQNHVYLTHDCVSLIAQAVKNPPAMQETAVRFLGQEDLLEKGWAPLWLGW